MYADKHPSYLRSVDLLSGGTGLLKKSSGSSPYCSCFFFPKTLQAVSLTFSALKLANSRNSLLIFLLLISKADFEKATSYFSMSISAFSQVYIFHVCISFFTSNLASQHSTFALSATIFFSASCLRRRL